MTQIKLHNPRYTLQAPPSLNDQLQLAYAYRLKGQLLEAKHICTRILQRDPKNFDALHLSAILAHQLSAYDEADHFFVTIICFEPEFADVHINYGLLLKEMKRYHDALFQFERAIILKSHLSEAYLNQGFCFLALGKMGEALTNFQKSISSKPDCAEPYFHSGIVLNAMKRPDAALASLKKAIRIKNDDSRAYYSCGVILHDQKRTNDALEYYDKAISLKPNYFEAYNNRGDVLTTLKRFDDALKSYSKALSINTNYANVFLNHGLALHELKRFNEALRSNEKAIARRPVYANAYNARANILTDLRRYDEALASYQKAIDCDPANFSLQSNYLFAMSYLEQIPFDFRLNAAIKFGNSVSAKAIDKFDTWEVNPTNTKLKVGFVSGDFLSHPVGYFLESVIVNLDKSKIETFAYTNNAYEDILTTRLKEKFDAYKSLVGMRDRQAASLIHADNVHILIDLSGHTALNRLPVFAFKPAPIQVSWLGYWATTGVAEIDYILGDHYVTPIREKHHFRERIKRLPESYFCFTPPDSVIEVGDLPALKNGFITFGCFNNFSKVNASVIALWVKVLKAVEGSRLLLKARQLQDTRIINDLILSFDSLGISSQRLSFEGPTDRKNYFQSYNKIDIALDPFPFPGGATSAEALWSGVPVLTKAGDCFVAHNGETIAHNSGQSEWIAQDDIDYIRKAVRFSSNLNALARLRSGLRAQILASPLFNAARFAKHFEETMLDIWLQHWDHS